MASQGFAWYELEAADIDGALAFYCPLLGWDSYEFPDPSGRYVIVMANGKGVGGIGALPGSASQPN